MARAPETDRIDCVVFDLDGTLVDTAPDLSAALNYVLAGLGREQVAPEEVRHMVGFGARAMIFKGLDLTGGRLPVEEIEILHRQFLDHYGKNIAVDSVPYPGAEPLLQMLKSAGKPLGICTNKPTGLAEELLNQLALGDYFSAVVGGDAVEMRKPDPGHLEAVFDSLSRSPPQGLFIGDSEIDFLAGRGLGVPVALMTHGYAQQPLSEIGANLVFDCFSELSEWFAEYI